MEPTRSGLRFFLKPTPGPGANRIGVERKPLNGNSSKTFVKPTPKSNSTRLSYDAHDEIDPDYGPGNYTEYRIMSTSRKGWQYNVMTFKDLTPPGIATLRQPIKMKRQDDQPPEPSHSTDGDGKKTFVRGTDGGPVIGFDGNPVIVGPDGKVASTSSATVEAATQNGNSKPNGSRRKMKMKEVLLLPDEDLRLSRERMYPWVLEEAPLKVKSQRASNSSNASSASTTIPGRSWIGKLENSMEGQRHALFVPASGTFLFVPSNMFYLFKKQMRNRINPEKLGAEYAKLQKTKDAAQRWKRDRGALAKATLSEDEDDGGYNSSKQLRAVDAGDDDLFGDDADDDEEKNFKSRRNKELGQEGDADEMDYEDEFADDDERVEMDGDEEEAKEREEFLRKQYRSANKARDGTIHDDDDEKTEEMNPLTGAGRNLKKLVKRNDENGAYGSDDDGDPYASEEEEEEEEEAEEDPLLGTFDDPSVMQPLTRSAPTAAATKRKSLKRKAFEDPESCAPASAVDHALKKRKVFIDEDMIITFLRKNKETSRKECVLRFKSYLDEPENKTAFMEITRRVAINKSGILTLKREYQ